MKPVTSLYKNSCKNFYYALLRRVISPFAEMEIHFKDSKRIADIGCGHGLFSLFLAQRNPHIKVYGFDPNLIRLQAGKAAAQGINNVLFICGQFITKGNFDGICLSDVFHHLEIEDQTRLLLKIYKSLSPGGILVIKEICTNDGIQYLLSSISDRILYPKEKVHFRSKTGWITLLEHSGFRVKHKRVWYNPFSTNIFVACKSS